MTARLAHVTLDCHDTRAQAAFWSAVLGRAVDDGGNEFFCSIGFPAVGEPAWLFLQVPESKSAKNRMHVDLVADDPAGEVARLVGLGARHVADHDEFGHIWAVLQDPEGNEFCVSADPTAGESSPTTG